VWKTRDFTDKRKGRFFNYSNQQDQSKYQKQIEEWCSNESKRVQEFEQQLVSATKDCFPPKPKLYQNQCMKNSELKSMVSKEKKLRNRLNNPNISERKRKELYEEKRNLKNQIRTKCNQLRTVITDEELKQIENLDYVGKYMKLSKD